MKKIWVLVWITIGASFIQTAQAQEAQIPFDDAGKYLTISPQIEKTVKLFSDYPDFREAKLFQIDTDTFVLEIMYMKEGKLLRDRKTLDAKGFEELRSKFANSALFQDKTRLLSQDGRVHFLSTTTGWGGGLYGWAIPLSFDFGARQTVGTWMLVGGSSFFIPFTFTKDSEISMSMARATRYGATRSFFHGISLYSLFVSEDSGTDEGFLSTAALLSIAEMSAFYQFAKKEVISEGRVEAIGMFGDLGFVSGALTSFVFTGKIDKTAGLTSLIGLGTGLAIGYKSTKNEQYSLGDVYHSQATSFLGSYGMGSIVNIFSNNDARSNAAGAVLGGALGSWYGAKMASEYDFSQTQGVYLLMSTFAGWATGLGSAYTFFGNLNESTLKPYSVLSSIGAIGGYYIMFNYLKEDAVLADDSSARIEWNINPAGVLAVAGELNGNHSKSIIPVQAFSLKFTF
ncbi:hypothetical protein EP331_11745 [bacterium]|nr:MAG: hypothetical protein EP331_11745 [bacterium]